MRNKQWQTHATSETTGKEEQQQRNRLVYLFIFYFFFFYFFFFFFLWGGGGGGEVLRPFQEYFTYIERDDRSSKVDKNRRTRGKTTWPSVSRTWLSHMWPERGSNHSGEKPRLPAIALEWSAEKLLRVGGLKNSLTRAKPRPLFWFNFILQTRYAYVWSA